MKKTLAKMMAAAMAITCLSVPAYAETPDLFIVGDSTACEYGYDENYAIPRAGWGMYIDKYIDGVKVTNLALSGRSSKSFTTEDNYKKLLSSVGEGDYVIIQFGHNDAKNTKEEDIQLRYTDPEGDKDTEGSFKNSLYKNYILPVQEKGATPILLTPISRRNFEGGRVKDSHGLYDDAVRELAEELGLTCIDMTSLTSITYNIAGEQGAMYYHAVYNDRAKGSNGVDNTHLNHWGGERIAYLTAEELSKAGLFNLKKAEAENSPLTRGEFTMGLVRALQADAGLEEYSNFADVKMDAEYAMAVAEAKALGIVVGDENAVFNGERPVTYKEVALMLERGLRASGAEMPEIAGEDMAARVDLAVANLGSLGIDMDVNKEITAADCYKALIDAYNEVTELHSLQAEKEQSLDEIEKTENVVLNK